MELKISKTQWESVADADKEQIKQIVAGFFPETVIVPDTATPATQPSDTVVRTFALHGIPKPFCTAGCDVLEAAAVAACAAIATPIGAAACIALAHKAADFCRSKC